MSAPVGACVECGRATARHVCPSCTPPGPEASDDAGGWQRMTDEASAIQMRHLDRNDGDVYHAMQSLVVKFGRRPNRPLTRERTAPQQPAAVDEAMERVRRGPARLWQADLVGGQISIDRMHEILTAALAGQQHGGTPE